MFNKTGLRELNPITYNLVIMKKVILIDYENVRKHDLRPLLKTGIFLLFCFLQAHAFEAGSTSAIYIPSRDYFSTLVVRIDSARSLIVAAVYLFSLYSGRSDAQTTRLAEALASARKRGVAVRVILDRIEQSQGFNAGEVNASNRVAYEYLRAHDIDVCFAHVSSAMHAKAVIIDSASVLIGSSNWTEAAFEKNIEANALIQSREFACAALAELGAIRTVAMKDHDTTAARVPLKFLSDTTLLGRMVSSHRERIFDVYLYLLALGYGQRPDSMMVLDYGPLIHYLGMDSLEVRRVRGLINMDLDALQNEYGLITKATAYGKDARIGLVPVPGDYVSVPSGYFSWRWNRELDFQGKIMELLSLYYSATSPDRPKWSLGVRAIHTQYGFTRQFIWRGTETLRRKNLLAVEHFPLPKDKEEARHPNIYMPLPLYDPATLSAKWNSLEAKYGKEETDRARKYAGLVLRDCDAGAVEKLIGLEKQYGTDKMEQAAGKITVKGVDNPLRNLEYFIGIVKKPEDEKSQKSGMLNGKEAFWTPPWSKPS